MPERHNPLKDISPRDIESILMSLSWRVSAPEALTVNVTEMRHFHHSDGARALTAHVTFVLGTQATPEPGPVEAEAKKPEPEPSTLEL